MRKAGDEEGGPAAPGYVLGWSDRLSGYFGCGGGGGKRGVRMTPDSEKPIPEIR